MKKTTRLYAFHFVLCLVILDSSVRGQVKWDGEGGDENWDNPLNWVGDNVPMVSSDVLLDNSIVSGSYAVSLPAGSTTITIKTVSITPASPNIIALVIPSSNNAAPALVSTGPGYGLTINDGGIFKNSSGAGSGATLSVADSIRINNGGRFIHNTARSHASNVSVLSRTDGTEEGIFEFDIPDASSTISISNRVFGKLILSSTAALGTVNYTGSATNPLTIKSDLVINNGVTFSLNMSDTIFIERDYIQNGGTVNLGSSSRTLIVAIKKNITQLSGVITETGTGQPEILLTGIQNHSVDIKGTIANSVSFTMNSVGNAKLAFPLALPYKLKLLKGKIETSVSNIIILLPGCVLHADSTAGDTFIDGPLKSFGLSSHPGFLFPVGKSDKQRWVALKNVTGNFTVEFHKMNPYKLDADVGSGINHLSSIEYWSIEEDGSADKQAIVELSFDNVNSGGVTDLSSLRVAHLSNGVWNNEGNNGTTGSPGAKGSVLSNLVTNFDTKFFTLSGSMANQNPLPAKLTSFNASEEDGVVKLNWATSPDFEPVQFDVEISFDGLNFRRIGRIMPLINNNVYTFYHPSKAGAKEYYRLKITEKPGTSFYSTTIAIINNLKSTLLSARVSAVSKGELRIVVYSPIKQKLVFVMVNINGQLLKKNEVMIPAGSTTIQFTVNQLPSGLYLVFGVSPTDRTNTVRIVVRGE